MCFLQYTGDAVHLTMVTPTPYGAGSFATITCFRSSPDTDITLNFGRPFQIGIAGSTIQTSTSLPAGSSFSFSGQPVTQHLTSSNDATGLFYCEGSNRGLTTKVYSIIHSVHSEKNLYVHCHSTWSWMLQNCQYRVKIHNQNTVTQPV